MTQPDKSDSPEVTLDDLRQASFVLGPSEGSHEFRIDGNVVVSFLRETEHLWDHRDGAEIGLWAVMIGALAERHRVHRMEHE